MSYTFEMIRLSKSQALLFDYCCLLHNLLFSETQLTFEGCEYFEGWGGGGVVEKKSVGVKGYYLVLISMFPNLVDYKSFLGSLIS